MSQMFSYAGRALAVVLVILALIARDSFSAAEWVTFAVGFAVAWGSAEFVYAYHRRRGLY